MRFYAQSEGFVFFVPVRGMSCILLECMLMRLKKGYRPREGYELHHMVLSVRERQQSVIVPVRGMSCILIIRAVEQPTEYLRVIVPVRGMSCI